MFNLTSNMTYFFDWRGNVPHTTFAPFAAYSLRRVVPTYYGPNIQVKRASDNAIANLYTDDGAAFTALAVSGGSNITDLTTINSWLSLSTNTIYVTTIFDQSGNALDLTACTADVFPRLKAQPGESEIPSPFIHFANTGFTVAFSQTVGSSLAAVGLMELFTTGSAGGLAIGNSNTQYYETVVRRQSDQKKLYVDSASNGNNVGSQVWGEAYGPQGWGYSYYTSWHEFVNQGQLKYSASYSGYTFATGRIGVGLYVH